MRNNKSGSRRQTWLTVYRFATVALLVVLVALSSVLVRRSFLPITSEQADKVEMASSLLESVGFGAPIYLGITPGAEGEYPTFRATAIGGEPVELWIRTTHNGGLEIQPVGVWESVASADDFAHLASNAVFSWENMPPDIQPRTDGSYGEYESRQYSYELLAKYAPDRSYWHIPRDEVGDWPRK